MKYRGGGRWGNNLVCTKRQKQINAISTHETTKVNFFSSNFFSIPNHPNLTNCHKKNIIRKLRNFSTLIILLNIKLRWIGVLIRGSSSRQLSKLWYLSRIVSSHKIDGSRSSYSTSKQISSQECRDVSCLTAAPFCRMTWHDRWMVGLAIMVRLHYKLHCSKFGGRVNN